MASERKALRAEFARAVDYFEWCWDCGTSARDCRDGERKCCCLDCRHRDAAAARILVDTATPIDLPAAFRAAVDAPEVRGSVVSADLRALADLLSGYSSTVIEAIGRVLLGEEG